jgi:hypothetical protein
MGRGFALDGVYRLLSIRRFMVLMEPFHGLFELAVCDVPVSEFWVAQVEPVPHASSNFGFFPNLIIRDLVVSRTPF